MESALYGGSPPLATKDDPVPSLLGGEPAADSSSLGNAGATQDATHFDASLHVPPPSTAASTPITASPLNLSWAGSFPPPTGLYDPAYEKDACGVGFIANLHGQASHEVLSDARILLCNMTHRGAEGAHARDSDGAGIMSSMPHSFFKAVLPEDVSKRLPPQGDYAVGNIFFPQAQDEQKRVMDKIEEFAAEMGLEILHWRDVPTNDEFLGPTALANKPAIKQAFIVKAPTEATRKESLLIQCHLLEKITVHRLKDENRLYFCSLSTARIVYKGLVIPFDLFEFFPDLEDAR